MAPLLGKGHLRGLQVAGLDERVFKAGEVILMDNAIVADARRLRKNLPLVNAAYLPDRNAEVPGDGTES